MINNVYIESPFKSNLLTLGLKNEFPANGYLVTGITGIGPSAGNILSEQMALSDGELYTGARLERREIGLTILFIPNTSQSQTIESLRNDIYRWFPVKKKIKFAVSTDAGKNLWCEPYVSQVEPIYFSEACGCTIQLVAMDPIMKFATISSTINSDYYSVNKSLNDNGTWIDAGGSKYYMSFAYTSYFTDGYSDMDSGYELSIPLNVSMIFSNHLVIKKAVSSKNLGNYVVEYMDIDCSKFDTSGLTPYSRLHVVCERGEKKIELIKYTGSEQFLSDNDGFGSDPTKYSAKSNALRALIPNTATWIETDKERYYKVDHPASSSAYQGINILLYTSSPSVSPDQTDILTTGLTNLQNKYGTLANYGQVKLRLLRKSYGV